MSLEAEYQSKIADWISTILKNPKNLASEVELQEQGKVALKYFREYDMDHTNTLTIDELKLLCDHLGLPVEKDEEELLMKLDKDGSGSVDLEEFISWWLRRISTLPNPMKQQEAIAKYTFSKYDSDKSGFLDHNEFRRLIDALGASFTDEEIDLAVREIDSDNSGVIECSEFVLWQTNRIMGQRDSCNMVALKLKKLALKANQIFSTDIFTAGWNGDKELIQNFLEGEQRLLLSSDETEYGDGWTLLHYCCYRGYLEIVQYLFENFPGSIQVNCTNNFGFTPLFYASQQGFIKIVELLLDNNADPTLYGVVHTESIDDETSESSKQQSIFMSPVEFVFDYPELRKLFLSHPKCKQPKKLMTDQYSLSFTSTLPKLLNGAYSLQLTIAPQLKSLSLLPIRSFILFLQISSSEHYATNPFFNYGKLCELCLSNYKKKKGMNNSGEFFLEVPANCPPSSGSYQQSIFLENKLVQFFQFIYFNEVLNCFTVLPLKSFLSLPTTGAEINMCAKHFISLSFQAFQKAYSVLSSLPCKQAFSKNFSQNSEEFFLIVFSRLIDELTSGNENHLNSEDRSFLSQAMFNLKSQLQEIFQEKRNQIEKLRESAAKENVDKKEGSKSGKSEGNSFISKYLSIEQLRDCVEKLYEQIDLKPPTDPDAKGNAEMAEANVGASKSKEMRKQDMKENKQGQSIAITRMGNVANSDPKKSNPSQTNFWSVKVVSPKLLLTVSLALNNILFESESSEPIEISFDFPFNM